MEFREKRRNGGGGKRHVWECLRVGRGSCSEWYTCMKLPKRFLM